MYVIYGQEAVVARWAGEAFGKHFTPPYTTLGFSRDGINLHGAAIFNGWNGSNIDVTVYGPGCITRTAIRAVYDYCFRQINANRVTARSARNNKTMLRLLPRLGFTWESVAKRYYGQGKRNDAIVFALFREDAEKWMRHAV